MKSIFVIPVFFFAVASLFAGSAASMNIANNGNPDEPTFQDFLAQFPKASLPYTFDAEDLQTQLEKRVTAPKATRLAWEYYQFLPLLEESARVSRMPVYPEAVASFETDDYYAVLYNTGRNFTKNFKSYHIAVFDKAGNHLATHFVAGANPNTLTAATIDETLHAKVQVYQLNWAKDYLENGFEGNFINSMIPSGKQNIDLTTGGMVEQVSWATNPGGLSASATAEAK